MSSVAPVTSTCRGHGSAGVGGAVPAGCAGLDHASMPTSASAVTANKEPTLFAMAGYGRSCKPVALSSRSR